ncbi:MAG: M28 family peptidase [Anaerolineae bacterium]|nr:M28 family peptidase [Anaerolineae bacterium]
MQHLFYLSGIGPHPTGTREQEQIRDYIAHWLRTQNWQVQLVPFVYKEVRGYNILAYKGDGPGILLGTHYDTRPISDRNPPELQHLPVPGANDGNSGTALLLEMARILREPQDFRIWLAFFDAEDMGNIDGWPFSVGASFASQMELNLKAVIVADMIGDKDLKIYQEANSDKTLTESIWGIARSLGFSEYFIPQVKYRIIDDHLPFALRGIPSALVIDFDYPYWHTSEDTPDKVSPESLEIVGRVLKTWVEKEGPKWVKRK